MKLVYCWITNYLNIKDQGFNFGSEWIYTTVNSKKALQSIERKMKNMSMIFLNWMVLALRM
jgi:hypothetical protein